MTEEFIDYGELIDDAMHVIVRKALEIIKQKGLPGDHHFFISFITQYPGVKVSKTLLDQYPDEMTIVLQYQFEDLEISNQGFSVTLSFSGIKESLYVPFAALTAFADPSVKFGLQFRHISEEYVDDDSDYDMDDDFFDDISDLGLDDADDDFDIEDTGDAKGSKKGKKKKSSDKKMPSNVVTLDSFRKKDS